MSKETKQWWEKASKGYQEMCKIPIGVHYGPSAPYEKELKLIGDVKGKKILEIGCGGAQCSIAFAKQGAKVTAIDISSEQIKFAKELTRKNNVDIVFYQRDIREFKQIKSKSQDLVFSAFALQYVDDLGRCFKEVKRVLKRKGMFIFSLDHPCYRLADPKTLKLKESYFDTGKHYEGKFVIFDHTFSELYSAAVGAGFLVEKIIEPDSRIKYKDDPWFGLWNFYIPKLLEKIPPTIIFKCRLK